jgi:TM2 domain-containing membrane protein YozV/ribosomal protein L40E
MSVTPPPVPPRALGEKYCTDCGSVISAKAEICPKCGVRQLPVPGLIGRSTPSGRNRIAAALFAILLGGLGIHKFYLGRVGQGILYLVFFWTFIPALVGFIEGIIYLTMSDRDFEEKYG